MTTRQINVTLTYEQAEALLSVGLLGLVDIEKWPGRQHAEQARIADKALDVIAAGIREARS